MSNVNDKVDDFHLQIICRYPNGIVNSAIFESDICSAIFSIDWTESDVH